MTLNLPDPAVPEHAEWTDIRRRLGAPVHSCATLPGGSEVKQSYYGISAEDTILVRIESRTPQSIWPELPVVLETILKKGVWQRAASPHAKPSDTVLLVTLEDYTIGVLLCPHPPILPTREFQTSIGERFECWIASGPF